MHETSTGEYLCSRCGEWIPPHTPHTCVTSIPVYTRPETNVPSGTNPSFAVFERIAVALERIAAKLEGLE